MNYCYIDSLRRHIFDNIFYLKAKDVTRINIEKDTDSIISVILHKYLSEAYYGDKPVYRNWCSK